MFLSHVDLIDKLLNYNIYKISTTNTWFSSIFVKNNRYAQLEKWTSSNFKYLRTSTNENIV
jgi:hypothetical protein